MARYIRRRSKSSGAGASKHTSLGYMRKKLLAARERVHNWNFPLERLSAKQNRLRRKTLKGDVYALHEIS